MNINLAGLYTIEITRTNQMNYLWENFKDRNNQVEIIKIPEKGGSSAHVTIYSVVRPGHVNILGEGEHMFITLYILGRIYL